MGVFLRRGGGTWRETNIRAQYVGSWLFSSDLIFRERLYVITKLPGLRTRWNNDISVMFSVTTDVQDVMDFLLQMG